MVPTYQLYCPVCLPVAADVVQWAMPYPQLVPQGFNATTLSIRLGQSINFTWDTCGTPPGTPARLHVSELSLASSGQRGYS